MGLTRSLQRGGVLLAAAVALALLHVPGRPASFCVLRTLTGVPCPLCGGTTAAAAVGRADLLGALRASPLAVLGALAFVAAPLLRVRPMPARALWPVVLGVAAVSELYQLHRFSLV